MVVVAGLLRKGVQKNMDYSLFIRFLNAKYVKTDAHFMHTKQYII